MRKIETYKRFLEKKGKYDYGCVMIYPDIDNWKEFTSEIDKDDLYKPKDSQYGIEKEPHVTLLYGIHDDVDDQEVIDIFKDVDIDDIEIGVNKINHFSNDDYDVVKLNVKKGKDIVKLNKKLKKLPHTNTYKDYNPHMTIAYTNPGEGSQYDSKNIATFSSSKIVYSKPNGEKIVIKK